ncbi:MAG: hypothetical protein M3O15_09515, partial [Acidobacteriota bacterium]|nr:hypothetical protein [Acidobacteriota bacterium]
SQPQHLPRLLPGMQPGYDQLEMPERTGRLSRDRDQVSKMPLLDISPPALPPPAPGPGQLRGPREAYRQELARAYEDGDRESSLRLALATSLFFRPRRALEVLLGMIELLEKTRAPLRAVAFARNNLGIVHLRLGGLDEAGEQLALSAKLLADGANDREVPASNLGVLDLLRGNLDGARRHFLEARQLATDPLALCAIRANQAALLAGCGKILQATREFCALAHEPAVTSHPPLADQVCCNLAQAYLEQALPKEALRWLNLCPKGEREMDDDLARSKRACLRLASHQQIGSLPEGSVSREAQILERTGKRQAWLYRQPWVPYCAQFGFGGVAVHP